MESEKRFTTILHILMSLLWVFLYELCETFENIVLKLHSLQKFILGAKGKVTTEAEAVADLAPAMTPPFGSTLLFNFFL